MDANSSYHIWLRITREWSDRVFRAADFGSDIAEIDLLLQQFVTLQWLQSRQWFICPHCQQWCTQENRSCKRCHGAIITYDFSHVLYEYRVAPDILPLIKFVRRTGTWTRLPAE